MGEKLAVRFLVTVNGREYHSAPDPSANGQPISLEIEHRDNEASRLGLVVWDGLNDTHFIEHDAIPNPRCNPNIPVVAFAGWEDEALVKVFEGVLTDKNAEYQLSNTNFGAIHKAFHLRRKAKVATFKEMTVGALLKKLAAEEGLVLTIDSTAAGDEALTTPASVFYQLGEANWAMMLRYIRSLGYVTNTIRSNEIVLKVDKGSGNTITLRRGDNELVNFRSRQQQKRDQRASKQKRHYYEPKPGKFGHKYENVDCGESKGILIVPPPIAKKTKQKRRDFTKFSVKGMARRLHNEGDEITISMRFRPEMRNEEIIVLSGFSSQLDGPWHTASVVHRLGNGAAKTDAACWRKE